MISLSPEIEALARRLAAAQQIPIEDAIRQALEARARVAGVALAAEIRSPLPSNAIAARRARMARYTREISALPVLDPRTPAKIMDDINPI